MVSKAHCADREETGKNRNQPISTGEAKTPPKKKTEVKRRRRKDELKDHTSLYDPGAGGRPLCNKLGVL